MTAVNPLGCYHCEEKDHWAADCPWLTLPDGKAEHDRRFAEIMRRFGYEEIGVTVKTRMITEENRLWAKRQKEMARQ